MVRASSALVELLRVNWSPSLVQAAVPPGGHGTCDGTAAGAHMCMHARVRASTRMHAHVVPRALALIVVVNFTPLHHICNFHGGSELRSWIRTGPNFGPGMLVKRFLSAGVEIGPLIIDFEFPFSTRI